MDNRVKLLVVVSFAASVAVWAYYTFYGFHWA